MKCRVGIGYITTRSSLIEGIELDLGFFLYDVTAQFLAMGLLMKETTTRERETPVFPR